MKYYFVKCGDLKAIFLIRRRDGDPRDGTWLLYQSSDGLRDPSQKWHQAFLVRAQEFHSHKQLTSAELCQLRLEGIQL